jgi:hypothetical protein
MKLVEVVASYLPSLVASYLVEAGGSSTAPARQRYGRVRIGPCNPLAARLPTNITAAEATLRMVAFVGTSR